jgi:hypothetical protein
MAYQRLPRNRGEFVPLADLRIQNSKKRTLQPIFGEATDFGITFASLSLSSAVTSNTGPFLAAPKPQSFPTSALKREVDGVGHAEEEEVLVDDFDGQCCRTYPYNHSRILRWHKEKRERRRQKSSAMAASSSSSSSGSVGSGASAGEPCKRQRRESASATSADGARSHHHHHQTTTDIYGGPVGTKSERAEAATAMLAAEVAQNDALQPPSSSGK